MKPVPFDYIRPESLVEACAALAEDPDARVIAGGQTLVPMLAMRLARPTRLIEIDRLPELGGVELLPGGDLRIGACVRQAAVEKSTQIAERLPLLTLCLPWVGHPSTRVRGTVGGSVANADPAAEIPLVTLVGQAVMEFHDTDGPGEMNAEDFFIAPMVTALPEGAILTGLRFAPPPDGRVGTAFFEVSARRSDFAFVSATAIAVFDEAGTCTRVRLGVGGAADTPVLLDTVSKALEGGEMTDPALDEAVRAAVEDLECEGDLHASAGYRRRGAAILAVRALRAARDDALGVAARC